MAAPRPFSLANVIGAGENILAARQRRDPNSLANQGLAQQNQLNALRIRQAEADLAGGKKDGNYSLTPFLVRDKNSGEMRAFQLYSGGGMEEVEIPGGFGPATKGTWKDTGGGLQFFEAYGPSSGPQQAEPLSPYIARGEEPNAPPVTPGFVPKTYAPGQSPEDKAEIAASTAQATGEAELRLAERQGDADAKIAAKRIKAEETERRRQGMIGKAQTQVGTMLTENRKLAKVIELSKAGANTGPIDRLLPSLFAETIAMEQLQNEMALDLVGATTFGALSKGELDLSRTTVLPDNLQGPDLIQWAQDKQIANQKLMEYLLEQVKFLSSGGTAAEWQAKIQESSGPQLPKGVTMEDVEFTAEKHGVTVDEVIKRLNDGP